MAKARRKATRKAAPRKKTVRRRKTAIMAAPAAKAPVARRRRKAAPVARRRRKSGVVAGNSKLISKSTAISLLAAAGVGYAQARLENSPSVPNIVKKIGIPGSVFLIGVANEYSGLVKGNIGMIINKAAMAGGIIYAYDKLKEMGTKHALEAGKATGAKMSGYDDYDDDLGYDDISGEFDDE